MKFQIKENLIDKAISYFSPGLGMKRRQARLGLQATSKGGYFGGSKTRRGVSGWNPFGGDADTDHQLDFEGLRNRSRDLARNDCTAGSAINTTCTNVVGPGLTPFPTIDRRALNLTMEQATEWERDTKRKFFVWANSVNCSADKTQSFWDIQEMSFRSFLESGDVFCHLPMAKRTKFWPFRLVLNVIESDRVCNPPGQQDTKDLIKGVRKIGGVPVRYVVADAHPGNRLYIKDKAKFKEIKIVGSKTGRRNIIHLMKKLRPGQTRGIPFLAPVIELLKQLSRYTEAEVMAAVISGYFTVFVKSESGGTDIATTLTEDETGQSDGDNDMALGQGTIVGLAEDESIDTANPGRPNAGFEQFVLAITRQIGAQLEIPFEILTKHFKSSYSAARAALLEAWKCWKTKRAWFARGFCQPIYEAWLDDMISSGQIVAPGYFDDIHTQAAWARAKWVGPAKGMINEKQELEAVKMRLEMNLSTGEQETIETTGGDYESNVEQRAKERKLLEKSGLIGGQGGEGPPQDPKQTPEEPEDLDKNDLEEGKENNEIN